MARTRTQRRRGPRRSKHASSGGIVAVVNGVAMSIGGIYVLTASVMVTMAAGVLAVIVVGLYLASTRDDSAEIDDVANLREARKGRRGGYRRFS